MMKVEVKKLSELKVSENNVRKSNILDDIDVYAQSIKTHGLLQPLVVNKDGEVFIGQKRLKALEKLGVDKVLIIKPDDANIPIAIQQDVSDEIALVRSVIENTVRKPVSMQDLQKAISKLMEKYGSINKVAKILGIPVDIIKVWCTFKVVETKKRATATKKSPLFESAEETTTTTETLPESPYMPKKVERPLQVNEQGVVKKPSDENVRVLSTGITTGVASSKIIALSVPLPIYNILLEIIAKQNTTLQNFILNLIIKYLKDKGVVDG